MPLLYTASKIIPKTTFNYSIHGTFYKIIDIIHPIIKFYMSNIPLPPKAGICMVVYTNTINIMSITLRETTHYSLIPLSHVSNHQTFSLTQIKKNVVRKKTGNQWQRKERASCIVPWEPLPWKWFLLYLHANRSGRLLPKFHITSLWTRALAARSLKYATLRLPRVMEERTVDKEKRKEEYFLCVL